MQKSSSIVEQIHNDFENSVNLDNNITPQQYKDAGFEVLGRISEYQDQFRLHKVITITQVKELCKKYNLLMSPIGRFAGHIPEKNMQEIHAFKKMYSEYSVQIGYGELVYFNDYGTAQQYCREKLQKFSNRWRKLMNGYFKVEPVFGNYFICAPRNNLILTNTKVNEGFEVITDDPIVLYAPAKDCSSYDQESHKNLFIICTAWGPESTDSNVVDQRKN